MQSKITVLALAISAILVTACNSDNDDKSTPPAPTPVVKTGVLVDAAVTGVSFDSGSQKGTTDANGQFKYIADETVSFKLGNINLGNAKASTTLLLKALNNGVNAQGNLSDTTLNRAVFLQTLDSDGDSSNGIQIASSTADKLKAASIAFDTTPAQFATNLTKLLSDTGIVATVIDAAVAKNHLLVAEAEVLGKATETFSDGIVTQIVRHTVPDEYVPYPGTNANLLKRFPKGFPLAVGSGLAYVGTANGATTFYAITDRGPNADSPALTDGTATKVFPAPNFAPTLVKLTVDSTGVKISDKKELNVNGQKISGRPLPKDAVGSSKETALSESLASLPSDINGLDTEALALDADKKHIWTCDEYGPFVAKIEIATGKIVEKFGPTTGLPSVIAKRQANRGCEGLAFGDGGKLYAAVQSTLDISKNSALFTRLVEFDPATKTSKTFAYPITPADWEDGKSGKAKLGDLVSLGNGRFITIEQGTFADGKVHNKLYVFDIKGATDISNIKSGADELEKVKDPAKLLELGVTRISKTYLGDLKDYGWLMEKAEGLTVIDNRTLALINDNDFGVSFEAKDSTGKVVDPTTLFVSNTGVITDSEGKTGYTYTVLNGKPAERRTQLWYIKLKNPLF